MTQQVSESFKKRESLRCLFASVASMEVIDWLLESGQWGEVIASAYGIDERLANIRLFFLSEWGLARQEAERKFIPMTSQLSHHVYSVLFSDAVRWWAAAHYSGQDKNKYLRTHMYKGEFAGFHDHFRHGFRNNQLAHFPGGEKSNDNSLLTPAPYGFSLTPKEADDFRTLLTYSIKLVMYDGGFCEDAWDDFIAYAGDEFEHMPEDHKQALKEALRHFRDDLDRKILKIPTRSYFPDPDRGGEDSDK